MSILNDNQPPLDEDTIYIGRRVYQQDNKSPDRAIDAVPGFLNNWRHSDAFKDQIGQA